MPSPGTVLRWAWLATGASVAALASAVALAPAWLVGSPGVFVLVFATVLPSLAWIAYVLVSAAEDRGDRSQSDAAKELDLDTLELEGSHVEVRGRWDGWDVSVLRGEVHQRRGPTIYRHVVEAATRDASAFASVETADGLSQAAEALGAGDLETGDAAADEGLEIRASDPEELGALLQPVPDEWRRLEASAFDTFRVDEGRVRYEWTSTSDDPPSTEQLRDAARLVVDVARGLSESVGRRPPPDALEDMGIAGLGARFELGGAVGLLSTGLLVALAGPLAGLGATAFIVTGLLALVFWGLVWGLGLRYRRVPSPPDGEGWTWEWPWLLGAAAWALAVALALPVTGPESTFAGENWVLATGLLVSAAGGLVFALVQRVQELRRTRSPSHRRA